MEIKANLCHHIRAVHLVGKLGPVPCYQSESRPLPCSLLLCNGSGNEREEERAVLYMCKWFLAEVLVSQIFFFSVLYSHASVRCSCFALHAEKRGGTLTACPFSWHSVLLLFFFQLWHLMMEIIWPRLQRVPVIKTSRCFWRVCGSWLSAETVPYLFIHPVTYRCCVCHS